MKPMLFTWIVVLFPWTLLPAQNLIRNPSFEEVMPYSHGINASQKRYHFTDNVKFWDTPTGGTPDIWLEAYRSDPKIGKGMKPLKPRTGESMIGIRIYGCHEIVGSHCREYLQTKTIETLKTGICYEYEYYAMSKVAGIRINNIGIGFSEFQMNDLTNGETIDLDFIFEPEEIIHDGVGKWCKISGSFTPEQDYNHIIIGNFSDDKNTKSIKLENGKREAYYFIDDVSIFQVDCDSGVKLNLRKPYTLSDINFLFNSAAITTEGKDRLQELYSLITSQEYESITINGFTDDAGKDTYNIKLSQKRAEAVVNQLVILGIPIDHMQAVGHGSINPIDKKNKAVNRRVEIIID